MYAPKHSSTVGYLRLERELPIELPAILGVKSNQMIRRK